MFNVSNSYREVTNKGFFKGRVAGTMTLENGKTVTIDDSNIINGSLSIDNKCVNNSEFCLGAVYVGQMSMTLYHPTIDRYSLYNAQVQLSYFLTLDDGTEEEEVPLGVFFVDKPSRSRKLIQLKCYDAMTKFDTSVEEDSWGFPYALLTLACEKVGVELANTEEQILAMCNGDKDFSLNSARINTYRDLLSYLSTMLGGFATINRLGQLEIRQFHTTPDLSISARQRTSSTVNDYETFFKSVRARFVAESNFYPYVETDEDMTTGLELDLGDIPIVQGMEEFKHEVLQNVLTVIKGIRYVPSSFNMISDPTIDLGDGLTLENANNTSESVFVIVTGMKWSHHKEQSVTSDGTDALLPNVSDSSKKQLDSMEAQIQAKSLVVKTFTNANDVKINGRDETIIRMAWSAFESTTAIFFATVPVEMYADGYIVLTYMRSLDKVGQLTKYLPRGKHFLTFTNYIASEADEQVTFIVQGRTEYFESDTRKHEAKIISLKDYIENQTYVEQPVDTSVPEAFVGAGEVRATVFAQGLNATEAWDGTLEFSETVGIVSFGTNYFTVLDNIRESLTTGGLTPQKKGMTDSIGLIKFTSAFKVQAVTDGTYHGEVHTKKTVQFNTNDYTERTSDGVLKLKTVYEFTGEDRTIDEGFLKYVQVKTSDKQSIESVVEE